MLPLQTIMVSQYYMYDYIARGYEANEHDVCRKVGVNVPVQERVYHCEGTVAIPPPDPVSALTVALMLWCTLVKFSAVTDGTSHGRNLGVSFIM